MNWESADLPTAWQTFKTHCEFMFKGPLKEKSEEEKCAYLMIWVGAKGREVYKTWQLNPEQAVKLDTLYDKYEKYVEPKSNRVFARYKFQCRVQQEAESAEQFITDLKRLVKDCGYEKSEEMVRDRIVCGTKNVKVKEKLLNEGSDLSLEKAIDIARSYEINQRQLNILNAKEDPNINTIRKARPFKSQTKPEAAKPRQDFKTIKPKVKSCSQCGYSHTAQQKCPALGKTCKKCHKRDHFAQMCMTKRRDKKVHQLQDTDEDYYDFDALFVGRIDCSKKKSKTTDLFTEKLSILNTEIQFQLDTGAKCNVLSITDFKKLKLSTALQKADTTLRSYSGHRIEPKGMIKLPVKFRDVEHTVQFYIVETKSQSVLSGETSEEIGLLKRINSIENEYPEIFEGLGCLPGTYHIKIDPNATPVVQPPKRIPIALKSKVKEEL